MRRLDISFKAFHKPVMLLFPHEKFRDNSYGVEAGFCGERQLTLGCFKSFFKFVFLPLINTVCTITAYEIAASYPGSLIIPIPYSFLAPLCSHLLCLLVITHLSTKFFRYSVSAVPTFRRRQQVPHP